MNIFGRSPRRFRLGSPVRQARLGPHSVRSSRRMFVTLTAALTALLPPFPLGGAHVLANATERNGE
jgi:hypothetical protein